MPIDIEKTAGIKTPEEIELERKYQEYARLETELANRELELATLKATMMAFERRYMTAMGRRFAEFDRINAEIAELLADRQGDPPAREQAQQARAKANETERLASQPSPAGESAETFMPSSDLKKLYRLVARKIHPDLAIDPEERAHRHEWMATANTAFASADLETLRSILEEWETSPEMVEGTGAGADLIRIIRKTAQVQRRLEAIAGEYEAVKASDLYRLQHKVKDAEMAGLDFLARMAQAMDRKIQAARVRRQALQDREPDHV